MRSGLDCFDEVGADGVTMRWVCNEVGVDGVTMRGVCNEVGVQ